MKKITFLIIAFLTLPLASFSQCFVKIGCGNGNVIGQKSDGTLWAWGWGTWGQAGNGSDQDQPTPTLFANSTQVWPFFESGTEATFTISAEGSLWGTGGNNVGQLGVGTTQPLYLSIQQINPGTLWKTVDSKSHTLGIQTNGTLWGWGFNDSSQMGNGTCCYDQISPIQIGLETDWKQVQTSVTGSSLAIKENGELWGWGDNSARLVGPTSSYTITYPTQVGTDTNWEYINVGITNGMGLKSDGTLWTWGDNFYGVNGNGFNNNIPHQVGSDTWQYISAGGHHSLGIKSDGSLWAWGLNNHGQLGDGTTTNRSAPVQIGLDTDWVSVAGGGYQHTVALKSNGSLWAWGRNNYGQHGNGTTTNSPTPVYIPVDGCALSVSDYQQIPMVMAPNPAQDRVSIHLKTGLENVSVEIFDLHGRKVLSSVESYGGEQLDLDISQFTAGVYMVRVQQNGKIISEQKLVKK